MLDELLRIERLSDVIAHSTAPAFLIGGVAGFVAIMLNRLGTLMDRVRQLRRAQNGTGAETSSEHEITQLKRRIKLLSRAVFIALCSGVSATILLLVGFVAGFLSLTHVYGMGTLFIVTVALLGLALALFAREIRLALTDYDTFE
jgi:hypothetical protein